MYVNSEILDWFPEEDYSIQENLGYLLALIKNSLNGLTVHPDADLLGFTLKDSNGQMMDYTHYAIYQHQNGDGWCAVECIPDLARGVDIDDEKYLVKHATPSRCVASIITHQKKYCPELYQTTIGVDEGYRRQWARDNRSA